MVMLIIQCKAKHIVWHSFSHMVYQHWHTGCPICPCVDRNLGTLSLRHRGRTKAQGGTCLWRMRLEAADSGIQDSWAVLGWDCFIIGQCF